MTPEIVAKSLGVNRQYVYSFEAGRPVPKAAFTVLHDFYAALAAPQQADSCREVAS